MDKLRKVQNADLQGKKVFLRADLDVPISHSRIVDDSRLSAILPTLDFLLENNAHVILAGHLGRPKNPNDFQYSLETVVSWYSKRLGLTVEEMEIDGFGGWKLSDNLTILENLRLYKEEEKNSEEFAKKLSSLAEIYVNDAFAVSHRAHASISGITKYLPSFAGLHLQKEVEELSKVLENPQRPLTIILGGAKIETKLPLVEKMHKFADYVLVGGEIAEHTKELAKVAHEKIEEQKSELLVADLTPDNEDIDEGSIKRFKEVILKSKTIVWNGPMGEFEKGFERGTKEIANAIADSSSYTIAGGGETVEFLRKENLTSKISFVSTGGGAMLEFLSGQALSGLDALSS
jgi:phosphoglycerate kinase